MAQPFFCTSFYLPNLALSARICSGNGSMLSSGGCRDLCQKLDGLHCSVRPQRHFPDLLDIVSGRVIETGTTAARKKWGLQWKMSPKWSYEE